MLGWTLHTIWNFIASSASVATIVGGIAVAVAILLPKQLDFVTDLRKWAIVVAAIAFSYSFIAAKFYNDGIAVKQAEWDVAKVAEAENGEQARNDAESAVRALPPDSMRNDPRNRDGWGKQPEAGSKGKVRWLESHRFFGKQR